MRTTRPIPKLPRYVDRAIDRGQWNPTLSLAVDKAIIQWDNYIAAEFPRHLQSEEGKAW